MPHLKRGLSQIILGGQSLIADGVKLCREIGYEGFEILMTDGGELTPEAGEARGAMRRTFRSRRDHLLELVGRLGLRAVKPDGAFYTMVDVAAYGASQRVAETLLDHAVITVPGATFGSEAEGFLRLSFCAEQSALTEGVRRIGAALAQLKPRQELPV